MMRLDLKEIEALPHLGEGSSFHAYQYQGYAIKVGAADERYPTLEGTRRLQLAGVPVLPIVDEWLTGDQWVYVQPRVQPLTDPRLMAQEGLEIVEQGARAGVYDLWPDNVCEYGGELCVIDPTMIELANPAMLESARERWGQLAREAYHDESQSVFDVCEE